MLSERAVRSRLVEQHVVSAPARQTSERFRPPWSDRRTLSGEGAIARDLRVGACPGSAYLRLFAGATGS